MIVIRVELWSARTGEKTELARMHISNTGTDTDTLRNYFGVTFRGRDATSLDREVPNRTGCVNRHAALNLHVWHLVAKMLRAMNYGDGDHE